MKLDEAQLQDISELVADRNTQRTLDKALRRTGANPIQGYTGSTGKESYVYGTLSSLNGTEQGFQFLAALVREIGVTPTNTEKLNLVFAGTPLELSVAGDKYELTESGAPTRPVMKPSPKVQAGRPARALVFLSHVRATPLVEHLASCLRRHLGEQIEPWLDQRITGGKWRPMIGEKLREADAMVVLGTHGIIRSTFVGYEIGFVDDKLGASSIFMLKAGLTTEQLQTCPPLDEFQNYDATTPTSFRDFLTKLAAELDLPPPSLDATAIAQDAAEFGRLSAEESRQATGIPPSQRIQAEKLLAHLDNCLNQAQLHTLQSRHPANGPEIASFDAARLQDLSDQLFEALTPQCRDALQAAVNRLRHANDLLALANAEDKTGQPPGPRRWAMMDDARHLREPLILAHALVLHTFGMPPRANYPRY